MAEPHFGFTAHGFPVHLRAVDHLPAKGIAQRVNKRLAVKVTAIVGSMWCAYFFGLIALVSLPAILTQAFHLRVFPGWLVNVSLGSLVAWVSSYFLQLVLLPVIMVGQNVQQEASDARAAKTFEDTEKILELLGQIAAGPSGETGHPAIPGQG